MNLFLYTHVPHVGGEQILSAVAPLISQGSIEVFQHLTGFVERLRRPKDVLSLAILMGPSKDDLRMLVASRDFLKETKTLLVLPDQDEETLFLAYRVFPAFITYVDSPMSDLTAVVKRLAEANGS
jgi:hypothetical protein